LGQVVCPTCQTVGVVAFNTAGGWARDVSEDIAREVLDRAADDTRLPDATRDFVAFHIGEPATLRAENSL
jgi:hypothetical protein